MFVLRNVSKADQTTYGCTVMMGGLGARSGPINLFVHGKSHYEEDLSLSVLPLISRFLSGEFQCALSFMSSQFSNIFRCKKKKTP